MKNVYLLKSDYTEYYTRKFREYQEVYIKITMDSVVVNSVKKVPQSMIEKAGKESFLTIKEYILKSVDFNLEDQTYKLQTLTHLSRLITFSFNNTIPHSFSFDFDISKIVDPQLLLDVDALFNLHDERWNIHVLQNTTKILDIILQPLTLARFHAYKHYEPQVVFAFSWILERFFNMNNYKYAVLIPLTKIFFDSMDMTRDLNSLLNVYFSAILKWLTQFEYDISLVNKLEDKLNIRQLRGVRYLIKKGYINRKSYAKLNRVSFMTAFRDLQDMVKKHIIKKDGTSSKTVYVLSLDKSLSN